MTITTSEEPLREPTPLERSYLDRLLTVDFAGRREVARQLESVRVRRIDAAGSLRLAPATAKPAAVEKRVPVEGEATDIDGVPVYFLLHVVDSHAHELEIYKADGAPILRMPAPEEIQVVALPA
jgi:hypothetical protein